MYLVRNKYHYLSDINDNDIDNENEKWPLVNEKQYTSGITFTNILLQHLDNKIIPAAFPSPPATLKSVILTQFGAASFGKVTSVMNPCFGK